MEMETKFTDQVVDLPSGITHSNNNKSAIVKSSFLNLTKIARESEEKDSEEIRLEPEAT